MHRAQTTKWWSIALTLHYKSQKKLLWLVFVLISCLQWQHFLCVCRMIIIDWMNSIQAHKHDAIIKSRIMTFLIGLLGLRRQRQTSSRDDKQPTAKQRAEKILFSTWNPSILLFFLQSSRFPSFGIQFLYLESVTHRSFTERERSDIWWLETDSLSSLNFFLLLPLPSISNVVFPPLIICCVRFELISTVSFFFAAAAPFLSPFMAFSTTIVHHTHTTTTSTWQSISIPSKSNDAKAKKSFSDD